jgi:hypothetical protein
MPFIQFQFRRGTATEWTSANTVLAAGEMGIETDTDLFKIGDGTTSWNVLSYGGLQGISGYSGFSGVSGFSGASGISGFSGTSGFSGRSGFSGWSGFSGDNPGSSGFSGLSGFSGFSGISGLSGFSGIPGPSTAINATDTTAAGTYYPVFIADSGSNQTPRIRKTATAFSFNPGTGEVSAVDFNSLSDASLKENIQPITNPLTMLSELNAVSFDWKNMSKKSFGFIAQEVEKVLPSIVTNVQDKKAISYIQIIPLLVEAIKELQNEIEELKKTK